MILEDTKHRMFARRVPYARGSSTSKEAASSMVPFVGNIAQRVLTHIRSCGDYGATCDEVEVALGMKHQTASARVNELKGRTEKRGVLIEDSGKKRKTRSKRFATVWVVATNGGTLAPAKVPKPTRAEFRQAAVELHSIYKSLEKADPNCRSASSVLLKIYRWMEDQ